MGIAFGIWAVGAALIGVWSFVKARPHNLGQWMGFVVITIFWPPFLIWVFASEPSA